MSKIQQQMSANGSSSSDDDDDDVDDGDQQQELLRLLEEQCRHNMGMSLGVQLGQASQEAESSGNDDESVQEDEEWSGIHQDSRESRLELAASTSKAAPQTIVFSERTGRPAKRTLEDEMYTKDSFMSSKVRSHIAPTSSYSSRDKGKKRALDDDEAVEERHLEQLDASLVSLIKDLPSSTAYTSSASLLPKLSEMHDPRVTYKRDRTGLSIDKKAPRLLREALYTSRLGRAKARAEAEKEGGIVAHKRDIDKGDFALTKRERNLQTGKEDKRRKNARGISGLVGKMKKGGAELRLSKDDIQRGREGDFEGIAASAARRRKSGHNGQQKKRGGKR